MIRFALKYVLCGVFYFSIFHLFVLREVFIFGDVRTPHTLVHVARQEPSTNKKKLRMLKDLLGKKDVTSRTFSNSGRN
jgi:hypothetical protein